MSLADKLRAKSLPDWVPHALIATLICTLIVGVAVLVLWGDAQRSRREAEVTTQNLSLVLAEQLGGLFARADALTLSATHYYADALRRGDLDRQPIADFLAKEVRQVLKARLLRILDRNGILRYSNDGLSGIDFSDRRFFAQARANAGSGLIFDGPMLGRTTKVWQLSLARRIEDADGNFAGVIYVALELDGIEQLFSSLDIGPSGIVVLRHLDMSLVARHPHVEVTESSGENRLVSAELRAAIAAQPLAGTYTAAAMLDNTRRVFSYHRLSDYPFYLIVGRATTDYMADWRRNVVIIGLLALACIGVTIAFSWRIHRSSRQLKLSEMRWRFALEGAAQGVWDADLVNRTCYWSPRIGELLGYADGEYHDTIDDRRGRLHPDDRLRVNYAIDVHLRGESPAYVCEHRMRRKDGTYTWIESRGMVIARGAHGDPQRMIGTDTRIDERKQAEERLAESLQLLEERNRELVAKGELLDAANRALRVSDERYAYAMQAARDGIWDWDLPSGRVYINPAYCHMLGYMPGELPSTVDGCWAATLHPDERAAVVSEVECKLNEQGAYEMELRQRCQDGSYKWVLARGITVARDGSGRPLRAVGTYVDITERKRNELQLVEARHEAESASRSKSAFLANMSHELRTPMNAIMGMTALLLRRVEDPGTRDSLGKIEHASHHLLDVINDILDISKVEAGQVSLEFIDFELRDIAERLANLIAPRAAEKNLAFAIELEPRLEQLRFSGDPVRLVQVLLNLAGNAVKFTEHGSVTVRIGLEQESESDRVLRFAVADTGIGIADETLPRLFTAFEQADSSMTRRYGGTGLGLAICKRLVHMMGGEIGVSSVPDTGSTFWFTVHLGHGQRQASVARAPNTPKAEALISACHAGKRLLLAEDNPINQEIARDMLEHVGLVVDVASDGVQAVDLATHNHYALILMDVQMPNLNGLDATHAIRLLPGCAHTPILAMTANAFDEDRQQCLDAGMDDHIRKPVAPGTLYAILLDWLTLAVVHTECDQ